MTINLDLEWKTDLPDIRVLVVGDVRDVIHSRAGRVAKLPRVTHGFGALSPGGPEMSGEGMIWRGRAGATPPFEMPAAVTGIPGMFSATFFLGWTGEPAAQGSFRAQGRNTLQDLYERLFAEIPAGYPAEGSSLLLLDILGTTRAEHIHDRAVKKPVHRGDTLITTRPGEYFNFHIVQEDLNRLGTPLDSTLSVAVVGAGYRPGGDSPSLKQFEQRVFYEPPRPEGAPAILTGQEGGKIKTHSHIMAWRPGRSQTWPPDAILHLDEWSEVAGGSLRVFAASPEMIEFVSA